MESSAFGFVEDGKVIRKAFGQHKERVIGEVNSTTEEAMAYFKERFTKLSDEVQEIADKMAAQNNKGSFLSKIEHLKCSLPDYDGLGDFASVDEKLDGMLAELHDYIEQNRHKNLQIKTALLEQLRPIAKSHEWKTASAQVKEIQQKWIKTGAVAEEKREQLEGEFKELIDGFYEQRAAFYKDLNQMMEEREADYQEFLISAKSLLEITDLDQLKKELRDRHQEWNALGKIKPKKHSEFWAQFQEVIQEALKRAKHKAKKVAGGNSQEQLKKLADFQDVLVKANEAVVPKADVKSLKDQWRLLQKIKHREAREIKQSIRFQLEMLSEKTFINSLVLKRKAKMEDFKFRQKISRDLLERDRRELITFEENLGKFNMAEGLDNMLTKKLKQQAQKVEVKKEILNQIKQQLAEK